MLTANIRDKLLVDELQLGHSLNDAVNNGDKAYFDLLLSMVSPDVTDDAAVTDPKREHPKNEDLRRMFELPTKKGFYSSENDFERADALGSIVRENSIFGLSLNLALEDEPLAVSADGISMEVANNISPLSRLKADLVSEGQGLTHEKFDLCTLAIVDAIDSARAASF